MKTEAIAHIGLFGGTFDPIHNGHLNVVQQLLQQFPFTQIQLIPCYQSPLRSMPQANATARLAMLQLACADHPQLAINTWELEQAKPSYTIDTLRHLTHQQPQSTYYLIIAADAFNHFDRWRNWSTLLTLTHLIIVNRPGYILQLSPALQNALAQHQVTHFTQLSTQRAGGIFIHTLQGLTISATQIRLAIQQGQGIEHWVPSKISTYIRQQMLYSGHE